MRVLFITDTHSATPRLQHFTKYLRKKGVEAVILSPPPSSAPANEPRKIPFKPLLRKIYYPIKGLKTYPDEMIWWRGLALKEAYSLIDGQSFDAIVSSSSPVTSHLIISVHLSTHPHPRPITVDSIREAMGIRADAWGHPATASSILTIEEYAELFDTMRSRDILFERNALHPASPEIVDMAVSRRVGFINGNDIHSLSQLQRSAESLRGDVDG